MNDVFSLDRDLVVIPCDRGGFRYEELNEGYVGGKLAVGSAYVDEDNVLVLVVDPRLTQTRNLEAFEVRNWRRHCDEAPTWDETATYRWEYAPGPWLDPVEDSDEIAVMSGL